MLGKEWVSVVFAIDIIGLRLRCAVQETKFLHPVFTFAPTLFTMFVVFIMQFSDLVKLHPSFRLTSF